MGHTALILGDQLVADNPAHDGAQRVLFVESHATLARVNLHRRRAHVALLAMRHLADALRETSEVEVVERRARRARCRTRLARSAPRRSRSRPSPTSRGGPA